MTFFGKIGFITPFRNKSLMIVLINYVLIVNIFLFDNTEASSRICRKLKHGLQDSLRYESVQDTEFCQCPPSSAPFSVYRVATGNTSSQEQMLLVCWVHDIKRFALQFENPVQIYDITSVQGIQIRACANNNDTVSYNRKHKDDDNFRLLLNLPVANTVPFVFRAYYNHKNKGIYYGHHRVLQYKYIGETEVHRRRRETVTSPPFTPSSECGKTRSCFRNGEESCDHFDCTYFLSYNTTDNKIIEVELSAKTSGWVAVGFSSDTKMGGDEVIVCRKTRKNEVESGSYKIQYSHQDPIPISGDNIINLKSFQIKDGYIYCHITRPLTVRMSSHQDLSNDWYQLYAYGPLSSNGGLEKHSKRPLVSRKLSMLRESNVVTNGSEKMNLLVSFAVASMFVSIFVKASCSQ